MYKALISSDFEKSLKSEFNSLTLNKTYLCKSNSTCFIDEYVKSIINYQCNIKNIKINDKYTILYQKFYNTSRLSNDCSKKLKSYPTLVLMCSLYETNCPIISTDIDTQSYKFKNIPLINKLGVHYLETGNHVIFDGTKYYGILPINKEQDLDCGYLKICLWDDAVEMLEDVTESKTENNVSNNLYDKINIIHCQSSVFEIEEHTFDSLFESILYKIKEPTTINSIKRILDTRSNIHTNVNITFIHREGINYTKMISTYGEIINDILCVIDHSKELDNSNRMNKNHIIQNILPIDVCYWILRDCFNSNEWKQSVHRNYEYYLNLETFPHLLNYVLFFSNFWLFEIKKLYKIPENLKLNINEIFLAKNTPSNIITTMENDGHFMILNIQINPDSDFLDGDVEFETNGKIKLKQSDCILYCGKKRRTPGNISSGVKYVLVIIFDVLL